ncbi:hypothetical protein PQG22_06880 [Aquirufa beregesia]
MARIWISEMKFSDDSTLKFEKDDIVVFVGPNNAGKSASLKESSRLLKSKVKTGKVLNDITIEKEGDYSEFFEQLETNSTKYFDSNPHPSYQGFGYSIYEPMVRNKWENYKNGLDDLHSFFTKRRFTRTKI